jgi:NADH:ubiquinone oxidoreductase subunit D
MHSRGVPLAFHVGGLKHRKTSFKHPGTREEMPDPALETLASWLDKMQVLIDECRELAARERAG